MMNPFLAMNAPLEKMDELELRYTLAYCDGEVRRVAENSTTMDRFEARRLAAERELAKRRSR